MAAHKRRTPNKEKEGKTMTINNVKTARMNTKMAAGEASRTNAWARIPNYAERVCILSAFCVAMVIASPAQTFTTLKFFSGTNGESPFVPLKNLRVVKVCAGDAITIATQKAERMQTLSA